MVLGLIARTGLNAIPGLRTPAGPAGNRRRPGPAVTPGDYSYLYFY